ncbi:MAG: recombinase family protein [Shimia sp.]|nr:recombinase family protein [Shimia sp.]
MVARFYGYARVSTQDQNLEIQLDALRKAGVHAAFIFQEKASGTSRSGRPELDKALTFLAPGDVLVVTKLDRLGRSMIDLCTIVEEIKRANAHLKVLDQNVDTTTVAGYAFFGMMAVFAEFEHGIRAERQREGIKRAKSNGTYKGRPKTVDENKIKQLAASGMKPAEIARELACHRSSVFRALSRTV